MQILYGGGGRREAITVGRHAPTFPVLSTGRIRRVASGWFGVSTPSNGSLFLPWIELIYVQGYFIHYTFSISFQNLEIFTIKLYNVVFWRNFLSD